MRQKTRGRVRRRSPSAANGPTTDPAEWILVNETGWGLPHGWIVLLAALFVGIRVLVRLAADGWTRISAGPRAGPPSGRE
jgi:hypothetical protein